MNVQEFRSELDDPANIIYEVNVSDIRSKNAEDIAKALRVKPPPDFSKLPPHLQKYRSLFCPEEAKSMPPYRPGVDHDIKLVDGASAPNSRMYGMSQNELLVLQKYIQENLDKGYIRPSTSPAASSVLFAKKPTGGLRLCVDYRKLNEVTVKDRTALPLTKESFARLSRAKYFTKVDVVSAFNRVRIKKGKEWLTAFRTRYGLFEYTVMPFGLCNAPATFIRLMNETLGFNLLDNAATPHMDDVIIFSETLEEHRRHVCQVFDRCLAEGLYLDLDKSEFEVQRTKYLGFILEAGKGISADPEKLAAIHDWQSPSSVKQVRSFLGFVNYYRRFIEGFSRIAKPLTDLTKRSHERFTWTPTAEQAFQELKTRLASAPILAHFDPEKPCVVVTDASNFASGAVLKQPADGSTDLKDLRPVAFFSQKHSDIETRYDAHDKELLAIIKAFQEWRSELEGSAHQVQVWCDHRNLQYFRTARMLNDRQARWSDFLSRFDLVIKYFPGRQNVEADALSRRHQDDTHEPKEQLLLPPSLFKLACQTSAQHPDSPTHGPTNLAAQPGLAPLENEAGQREVTAQPPEHPDSELSPDLAGKLREAYANAPPIDPVQRIAQLLAEGARHSPYPLADCQAVDGRVYYQGRLWLPVDDDLRRAIIEENHSPPLVGHPGAAGTYSRIQKAFYWPKMHQDIRRFIRNCHPCQRSKPARNTPGQLLPLPVPLERWHDITMDFITDLPPATRSTLCPGATSILVVVCRLSKEEHIIPCSKMTAEYLAAVFVRDVIRLHGIPRSIVTDRGPQFTSVIWKEICRLLGMKQSLTSAFHPQSDGQSERSNQEIEHHLRRLVGYTQEDWADWCPVVEFARNSATKSATGMSPFEATRGFNPRAVVTATRPAPAQPLLNIAPTMKKILSELQDNMTLTRRLMADSSGGSPHPDYKVGDLVWLSTRNLKTHRACKKMDDKWFGPYPIIEIINSRAYKLQLPHDMHIHPVFHASLLRLAATDPMTGQVNPEHRPGPVTDTNWEVEEIIDLVRRGRGWRYLVKWQGWPHDTNTYEPLEHLVSDAEDALIEFEHRTGKIHPARK